jgi:hypothetical protein
MESLTALAKLPRLKPGRRGTLHQILEMQRVLVADALSPDTPPNVRAQVSRAWCELEERKRIIRGKPLPGSYRPQVKPGRAPKPWDTGLEK